MEQPDPNASTSFFKESSGEWASVGGFEGSRAGKLFYTHISDQYAPFNSQVVNLGVRNFTYVLDGLLHP